MSTKLDEKLLKTQSLIKKYQSIKRDIVNVERNIKDYGGESEWQEQHEGMEVYRSTGVFGGSIEISTLVACIEDVTLSKEGEYFSNNVNITEAQLKSVDIEDLTIHFKTYEEPVPWEDYTVTVTDIIFKGNVDFTVEQKQEELDKLQATLYELNKTLSELEEELVKDKGD